MTTTAFETINIQVLADITGGSDLSDNLANLGKAAVNGGVNVLNFFHDHPVEFGPWKFSLGGDRVTKPFTDDPLSRLHRTIPGKAHPAKR